MISNSNKVPIKIAGGSEFGLYAKIGAEKTFNMFITKGADGVDWLVNYAGFQAVTQLIAQGEGRAVYHSVRGDFLIIVVSSTVYRFSMSGAITIIGLLGTTTGEVSIDENLISQVCIVDGTYAYIYNYSGTVTSALTRQTLDYVSPAAGTWTVTPNYVCYHNSYFLIASNPDTNFPQNWYAAVPGARPPVGPPPPFDGTQIYIPPDNQFAIQTKPDSAVAIKRIPGAGSNVIIFGETVAEIWTQVPNTIPYQKIQSSSLDSGCLSINTIAANEDYICWLAQNESNAAYIMVLHGNEKLRLSTDGIDNVLQHLVNPSMSTGFMYSQDGHLFYQLTFYDPADNITLMYDFNTNKFFNLSDEKLNYHPARQVVFFNDKSYFVSINDATLYEMSSKYISYNYSTDVHAIGKTIPRIRITNTFASPDSARFRVGSFTFRIEQGVNTYHDAVCTCYIITEDENYTITETSDYIVLEDCDCVNEMSAPRVDMSFSKNGNQSFSNVVSRPLNSEGNYRNQIRWHEMGEANEFTIQLRFWGLQRFVVSDGILEVY